MSKTSNTQENQKGIIGLVFSYTALLCGVTIALTLLWAHTNGLLNEISTIQSIDLFLVIASLTVGGLIGLIWYKED